MGIGLLPNYAAIGVWAPILLVLRFVQGIGVGGEWGGAVLMAAEHAPKGKAGLYGATPDGRPGRCRARQRRLPALHQLTTEEQFTSWGWRVPFLLSATLVMVAMWIRLGVMESPFEAVEKEDRIAKSRSSRSSRRAGEPCCSPAAPSSPPTASPTSSWSRCSATAPPSSATAAAPCSPC